jgi:hypothetical protein
MNTKTAKLVGSIVHALWAIPLLVYCAHNAPLFWVSIGLYFLAVDELLRLVTSWQES